jgi:hypothetical protein
MNSGHRWVVVFLNVGAGALALLLAGHFGVSEAPADASLFVLLALLFLVWVAGDVIMIVLGLAPSLFVVIVFNAVFVVGSGFAGAIAAHFELLEEAHVSAFSAVSFLAAVWVVGNVSMLIARAPARRAADGSRGC